MLEPVLKKSVGGVDALATLKYVACTKPMPASSTGPKRLGNTKVQVAYEIPDNMHEPIVYPLVLLKQGANRQRVRGSTII